ncbi:MAG TPA: CHRD domain-containing protein [Vicinamibacterales bacterium]|jgi:hypothetical protein|nr:CHRD domain-containing protein [Vicinamibacterales bacterium]
MKRFPILFIALVLMAGCGDSDTAPADDNRPQFTASLLPSNEVPAITDSEATGSGTAVIHFNLTRDAAGAITAATADFTVEMSGFPATTTITISHIHIGAAGVNGGIQVNTGINSDVPLNNGVGTFTRNGISFGAATAQAILNNPAGYYFNVHSSAHPGGVIRGQLTRS